MLVKSSDTKLQQTTNNVHYYWDVELLYMHRFCAVIFLYCIIRLYGILVIDILWYQTTDKFFNYLSVNKVIFILSN